MRDLESVSAAGRQAGQVLRSKKATHEQKTEAVKVLGTAIATEVGKKVVEHVGKEAKEALSHPETRAALKSGLKAVAGSGAAAAGLTGAAIAGTLYVGAKVLAANRNREARLWADEQLAATGKKIRLTQAQADTLWKQYYDYAVKKPTENPFLGK